MTNRALRACVAFFIASSGAGAVEIRTGSENVTLQIEPLIQARAQADFDGPPGAAAPAGDENVDFYVRRARVLVRGSAYRQFEFGINIVAIRIGERGNLNVSPFLQDIRIAYVPVKDVNFEIGLLLMPLSHAAVEAAGFYSSLEGVGAILLYNNARQLRETGVQVRALVLDRRVLIRGGFYEGARNTNPPTQPALNPHGVPLAGGMIRLNVVGEETAYAFDGIYLDDKTRISVGFGAQYQPRSGGLQPGSTTYDDYKAFAVDLFADVALRRDMEAIVEIGGYRFDYGTGNAKTGYGMHAETGYRWGRVEPLATFYWFNSDTKENSFLKVAGGLNVFLHGHSAKLQAEFASVINNANLQKTPALHQVVAQIQLAF